MSCDGPIVSNDIIPVVYKVLDWSSVDGGDSGDDGVVGSCVGGAVMSGDGVGGPSSIGNSS